MPASRRRGSHIPPQSSGDTGGAYGRGYGVKGHRTGRAEVFLFVSQLTYLLLELLAFRRKVVGLDTGLFQRLAHLFKLLGLLFERLPSIVELKLLCQQFVLHVGGFVAGLIHLALDVIILLLKIAQLALGFGYRRLLLLISSDIRLGFVESINFPLQVSKLFLRSLERSRKRAAYLRVQLK